MPVTVTNIKTNEVKCDDCCAKLVHDADKLKRIVPNPERSEKNWIDLPTAVAIRTMLTHFDQITEKDVVIH